jgi:hypothetical protein
MDITVAVRAVLKLQAPVSPLQRKLGRMAALALDTLVQTHQGKRRLRMRAQPDLFRQPRPANAGMTVLAPVSELRLVYLRMASHALRSRARSRNVALVVTGLALRLGVTPGEAQHRMILPDVGDLAPIGFVVTGDALRPFKRSLVGILVTGHTLGLQAEKRSVAAAVLAVVTVRASGRPVSAFERPTRLSMIEALGRAARPSNEPRTPSEMFDVTAAALLPPILPSVQARLLPDLRAQVLVAPKAGVRVDPFSRGVTFAAIRIPIDVGVATSELPGRQELGAGWAGHQRSGNRGHCHHGADGQQRCDPPPHSEKIQRYP